jgi:hypothetical protein
MNLVFFIFLSHIFLSVFFTLRLIAFSFKERVGM